VLITFPRSQPPVFYEEEEKQNEVLTLYSKGTGTTISDAAVENRQLRQQKSNRVTGEDKMTIS
jgi:hypothetical protein